MSTEQGKVLKRIDKLMGGLPAAPPDNVDPLATPSIVEFLGPDYLNLPGAFPRQATLLKVVTLQVELLTDYDRDVIAEWESGFVPTDVDGVLELVGTSGCAPGLIERMLACRADGRDWFREIVLVLGRRAGKSHITAIVIAYALWKLLALDSPQRHFGIPDTKQLVAMVFATRKDQAARDLHRDLTNMIAAAPCFAPFIGRKGASLRLRTPTDRRDRPGGQGSILVEAQATTATAGRGPASVAFAFDEMAHAADDGMSGGADEVYLGAAPALAQFPTFSLTIMASSPASKTGEFYAAFRRAMAITDEGPVDVGMFAVQLASWELYKDWSHADKIPMWPGGPMFEAKPAPLIAEDSPMVLAAARRNLAEYRVEYAAQWRSSQFSFFREDDVLAMFGPFGGERLYMQHTGQPHVDYAIHCDPSRRRANYGIAVGHLVGDRLNGHVVFDFLRDFPPGAFENGEINTEFMLDYVWDLVVRFKPSVISFDSYDSHYALDVFKRRIQEHGLTGRIQVKERIETAALNYRTAEMFGTLLAEHRIHAPDHALTRNELVFMEERNGRIDHPTTGPVTTSDMADSVFAVVDHLMDGSAETFHALSNVTLTGTYLLANRPSTFDAFNAARRYPGGYNPARGHRRPGGRGSHR